MCSASYRRFNPLKPCSEHECVGGNDRNERIIIFSLLLPVVEEFRDILPSTYDKHRTRLADKPSRRRLWRVGAVFGTNLRHRLAGEGDAAQRTNAHGPTRDLAASFLGNVFADCHLCAPAELGSGTPPYRMGTIWSQKSCAIGPTARRNSANMLLLTALLGC